MYAKSLNNLFMKVIKWERKGNFKYVLNKIQVIYVCFISQSAL